MPARSGALSLSGPMDPARLLPTNIQKASLTNQQQVGGVADNRRGEGQVGGASGRCNNYEL